MASGFKKATVTSGDVPSTQTNFPAYVDLSRIGITTLAEAQSVRVYADSSKTTEWAREIVSASEMHTKIPSLTSTTDIYVDWDGVRADYAATDTYGRNAVWSSYEFVSHLIGTTDSAGNHNLTANGGVTLGGVAAQIGNGTDFDGSNDTATHTSTNMGAKGAFAVQFWINPDTVSTRQGVVMNTDGTGFASDSFGVEMGATSGVLQFRLSTSSIGSGFSSLDSTASMTTGSWQKVTATRNSNVASIYRNGTSIGSSSGFVTANSNNLALFGIGAFGTGAFLYYNGKLDEVRVANFEITANWETTEYNNQSDESGFWGTWTTVTGFTPSPMIHMMGITGGII